MHRIAAKQLYETFGGNLRFFGIGGAKLDAIVDRFLFEGKHFPFAIGYGLTETAPLIAGTSPSMVYPGSTGPAIKDLKLIIHNPNSQGEGEIWVKGDNVMKGYYKEPELTREVLTEDGWFKTGDLGCLDTRGFLYIKGRLKNMILGSSGENIYPEDIESVINNHRFVSESLVIEDKGKLIAKVLFNQDELNLHFKEVKIHLKQEIDEMMELMKTEVMNYVNSKVNKFSKISIVEQQHEDFEKTSTQKIKRYLYLKTHSSEKKK
jgi:long-chain acyl-CoA synthetase